MSELTIQSLEHGADKPHDDVDYSLMCRYAAARRYMEDRAIGLRYPQWSTAWIRDHAQAAAQVRR